MTRGRDIAVVALDRTAMLTAGQTLRTVASTRRRSRSGFGAATIQLLERAGRTLEMVATAPPLEADPTPEQLGELAEHLIGTAMCRTSTPNDAADSLVAALGKLAKMHRYPRQMLGELIEQLMYVRDGFDASKEPQA